METEKKKQKFSQSLTFKGLSIIVLVLLLLIPQNMLLNLVEERQERSREAIGKINEKWSTSQTICGPVLSIPYTKKVVQIETVESKDKKIETREHVTFKKHVLNIAPNELKITTKLFPEEKYYGIYKTILYGSNIEISGNFKNIALKLSDDYKFDFDNAYLSIGLSDLKGVTNQVDILLAGQTLSTEASGAYNGYSEKQLIGNISNLKALLEDNKALDFQANLSLNGSGSMNFIPVGKNTEVNVSGAWKSPGFVGNFSPDSTIETDSFSAQWNVLHFNRNIPETWTDADAELFIESYFGVNLVEMVDHYQQNSRSTKYALMFIALTFVVFFFVEVLTKKKIHPIQYLLVGIALILFYSLLLSISEQINFAVAYLIASVATISLIAGYTKSIFKNRIQTGILTVLLCILYVFLYVILQLEDVALLIGSIGLFVILAVIMYFSKKINFYKQEEISELGA